MKNEKKLVAGASELGKLKALFIPPPLCDSPKDPKSVVLSSTS